MSAHRSVFAPLDTRMAAYTPALPIAWPNRVYTPTTGVSYLKVDHLPSPTVRRSIGSDGQNVYTGIFQVVGNTPADKGPGEAEILADSIANFFPLGAVYSGVRIAAVSVAPAVTDAPWYRTPVSITYEFVTTA